MSFSFDIRIFTTGRYSIAKCRAKSKVLTSESSLSPGGGAYSRALKAVKS